MISKKKNLFEKMEDAGGYTKHRINNQWNLTSALHVQHKTKTKPLKHTAGLSS